MKGESTKKNVPIAIRVSEPLDRDLREIARRADRPVGYVVRELAIRGLSLYRTDKKLRENGTADK